MKTLKGPILIFSFVLPLLLSGCWIEDSMESQRYELVEEIPSPDGDLKVVSYVRMNGATSLNCYRLSIQEADKAFNGQDYVNAKKDTDFFSCDYPDAYTVEWIDNSTLLVNIREGTETHYQKDAFRDVEIVYTYYEQTDKAFQDIQEIPLEQEPGF